LDCVQGTVVVPAPPVERVQVPVVDVKPAPDTCTDVPTVPEFGVRAICGLTLNGEGVAGESPPVPVTVIA
jgi:hypothetical protein